jgi:hypothetical protein
MSRPAEGAATDTDRDRLTSASLTILPNALGMRGNHMMIGKSIDHNAYGTAEGVARRGSRP